MRRLTRNRTLAIGGGLLLGLAAACLFRENPPPPVQVWTSITNAPVRVFPGVTGAFIVLPDGSLWRWGQTGGSAFTRAAVPEPVGTNLGWVQAFAAHRLFYGPTPA